MEMTSERLEYYEVHCSGYLIGGKDSGGNVTSGST